MLHGVESLFLEISVFENLNLLGMFFRYAKGSLSRDCLLPRAFRVGLLATGPREFFEFFPFFSE